MKIISCTNNKKASKYKDSRKNVVFMGVLKIRTNRVQVPSSAFDESTIEFRPHGLNDNSAFSYK